MTDLSIFALNFWNGFSLGSNAGNSSFVNFLLRQAVGPYTAAASEADADIVLVSVFGPQRPLDPRRTIGFIWENIRPNYKVMAYSISSDFDTYGGKNCRIPYWYSQLQWPGFSIDASVPAQNNHGFEPLMDIEGLLRPRSPRSLSDADLFCSFVAGNPEAHRILAARHLATKGQVDMFGNIANPLRTSKYEILPRYRFNLCFENATFPGYYTEKILHAWAGGCVPLYYSDPWFHEDFNPDAMINRINFKNLDAFADHVAAVNDSPAAYNKIYEQPLLTRRPMIEPAIEFLRKAVAQILDHN